MHLPESIFTGSCFTIYQLSLLGKLRILIKKCLRIQLADREYPAMPIKYFSRSIRLVFLMTPLAATIAIDNITRQPQSHTFLMYA